MKETPVHVGIVGDGIGGFSLAPGLKTKDGGVAVDDRDRTSIARLWGHRAHLDPRSVRWSLPPPSETFVEARAGDRFRIFHEWMLELLAYAPGLRADLFERAYLANPLTIFDDASSFEKAFVRHIAEADGRTSTFEANALRDLLAGCERDNSRLRRLRLSHDDGIVSRAGKLILTDRHRIERPPSVLSGVGLVLLPGRRAEVLAKQGPSDDGAARETSAFSDNTSSNALWAHGVFRTEIEVHEQLDLDMEAIVRLPAGRSVGATRGETSEPRDSWMTPRATPIGDSIHGKRMDSGIGGDGAPGDASLVRAILAAAPAGEDPPERAPATTRSRGEPNASLADRSMRARRPAGTYPGIAVQLTRSGFGAGAAMLTFIILFASAFNVADKSSPARVSRSVPNQTRPWEIKTPSISALVSRPGVTGARATPRQTHDLALAATPSIWEPNGTVPSRSLLFQPSVAKAVTVESLESKTALKEIETWQDVNRPTIAAGPARPAGPVGAALVQSPSGEPGDAAADHHPSTRHRSKKASADRRAGSPPAHVRPDRATTALPDALKPQ